MKTIDINNMQDCLEIDPATVEGWASRTLDVLERDGAELSIVLVDNSYIQELNRLYLNRDRPTNVISFPQQEGFGPAGTHLGDIVISAERAIEEAEDTELSPDQRLKQLLVHGICHLCGFNHEDVPEAQALEMEAMEKKILDHLNND